MLHLVDNKYWHFFWQARKIHLMRTLEYRANFVFWTVTSIAWACFNFFFFGLLINVNNGFAGWSTFELYTVVAIYTMLDAFIWSVFHLNMQAYTSSIFSGDLNTLLLKPIDTQFLLMTQNNSYTNVARFLLGLTVLIYSLLQLGVVPSIWQILVFIFTFSTGLVFLYNIWFMLSTLAFWVDKLDNINDILPSMDRIWQVPRGVFTGSASMLFTFIFPLLLVTSLPSEVLLNKVTWPGPVYFFLVTCITALASRFFFQYSIQRYSGIAN